MIPKKIFFYWDGAAPASLVSNVQNFKELLPDFEIFLISDDFLGEFKENFPLMVELISHISIPSLKSDLIRLLIMYQEGGMWLDCHTTLKDPMALRDLFDKFSDFDFVITVLRNRNYDLKTSALLSKPKSSLAFDTAERVFQNLTAHYDVEKSSNEYVPYNLFLFIAPVVWVDMLKYTFNDQFRESIAMAFEAVPERLTLELPEFQKYNVGLMDVENTLTFYGCDLGHHKGSGFLERHWSEVQKHQRLFF